MSRGHAASQTEFGTLFRELLATRARYEGLRMGNGPFGERAELLNRLHSLRHDMDLVRTTLR